MLYLIEFLPYDKKYSEEKQDVYWNGKMYVGYKEISYIKISHKINLYIESRQNDYILITETNSYLFRD